MLEVMKYYKHAIEVVGDFRHSTENVYKGHPVSVKGLHRALRPKVVYYKPNKMCINCPFRTKV